MFFAKIHTLIVFLSIVLIDHQTNCLTTLSMTHQQSTPEPQAMNLQREQMAQIHTRDKSHLLTNRHSLSQQSLFMGQKINNTEKQQHYSQPFIVWAEIIFPATVGVAAIVLVGYALIKYFKKQMPNEENTDKNSVMYASGISKLENQEKSESMKHGQKQTDHIEQSEKPEKVKGSRYI